MNENATKSEVKIKTNKAKKGLSKDELEKLEKSDLIEMVIRLEAYNKQLKNILDKKINPQIEKNEKPIVIGKKTFDFSKFTKRHIMLKFLYLGWDYEGIYLLYKFHHNSNNFITIIFNALRICCSRSYQQYNRASAI